MKIINIKWAAEGLLSVLGKEEFVQWNMIHTQH